MTRLVITDSGLGGLSICAGLAKLLEEQKLSDNIEILYINAVPKVNYGYNSMHSRQEKLTLFNQFLKQIDQIYDPSLIFIACHSLSVIYPETSFAQESATPVHGILEIGLNAILEKYAKSTGIIILATDTTVEEDAYKKLLIQAGLPSENIVSQACTGLANLISNDLNGQKTRQLINDYLIAAHDKFTKSYSDYLVYLGCTHYGHRHSIFESAVKKANNSTIIVNPNSTAVEYIYDLINKPTNVNNSGKWNVKFITSYPIPSREINTLSAYLSSVSPVTVKALQEFTVTSDLF